MDKLSFKARKRGLSRSLIHGEALCILWGGCWGRKGCLQKTQSLASGDLRANDWQDV